ncbi:MAG: rhodanese-like domain-containing protein [Culicoidibacterales bacterium]
MMRLTANQLLQQFDMYLIVDVRTPMCYHYYHIPYSVHLLTYKEHFQNTDKMICFVCGDGTVSEKIASESLQNFLEGGLKMWIQLDVDEALAKRYLKNECCTGRNCKKNKNL